MLQHLPLKRLLIAVAATTLLAAGGDAPTPWPGGDPPSDAAIAEQVDDALALAELERFEEFFEAFEKGEDSEHFAVFQEAIDAGEFTVDDLFVFGDALFGHEFRTENGYGDQGRPVPLQRVHNGQRGGLDTFSCFGCHSLGGPDGAGAVTQNALFDGDGLDERSALVRNPPAVIGLGFVQAVAVEMTSELQWLRTMALDEAVSSQSARTVALETTGVAFGTLTARPDGSVDTTGVEGIDADLVVRPFGWKGKFATLRRTIEDAARVHFGVQSAVLAAASQQSPNPELLGPGPNWWDPDNDGVQREIEEGTLTAASVYLAMLESPVIVPPSSPALRDRWSRGSALFDEAGCDDCHRRTMAIGNGRLLVRSDSTSADPVEVDLKFDGEFPKSSNAVALFSDLKRHAMGAELAEPRPEAGSGVPGDVWLTRPLWGLAETPPYLHDGRAATVPAAIAAHGGEGEDSRDRFEALAPEAQADLHIFLLSLTRAPKVRVPL